MAVEFGVLGGVGATVDGEAVEVGHARQRAVLAVLLIELNEPVPADTLIDRVWAGGLPRHPRTTLAGYVSRLRHLLAGVPIPRGPGGYALLADPDTVDLHRFRRLVAGARAATDDAAAARLFAAALGLWRGEPFGGLDLPWLNGVRAELEAARHAVELDRNDLALQHGEHAALLGDLARGSARYPLDERLAAQEMTALHRSGRSAAALERYTRLRDTLAGELGTDPGPALRALYRDIVAGEPASQDAASRPRSSPVIARQLPAAPRAFTGRAAALARLDAALDRDRAAPVVISSVTGTAGVGKTALALHWAHRVADRFPDGQLYVNLRGYDPDRAATSPAEALRDLLRTLGLEPERTPHGVDSRAALYRSLLAGRRMLVVLDNARDAGQVRPLLPGSPHCMVVVTSRNRLPGLVALDDAQPVELDLLAVEDAVRLLDRRIGGHRVAAEPAAVRTLVDRCARLPLALSIMAGRAVHSPDLPLAALARELDTARTALDGFASDDPAIDVRAVFDCSYRALDVAAATLFRLLGVHWGPDITVAAAAALAGVPVDKARSTLAELAEVSLLQEHLPGRYALHDLLRAYVRELVRSDPGASPARARLLSHYVHTAHRADLLVYPAREPIEPPATVDGGTAERFADPDAAASWFAAEQAVLVGAFSEAGDELDDSALWHLAWAMSNVLNLHGNWRDQEYVQRKAVAAARRLGDPLREAHALRALGRVRDILHRGAEAVADLRAALDLFDAAGERAGAAQTHINLARICQREGADDEALAHDQAALRLYRESGSRTGQARALNNVGGGLARQGRLAEALAACRTSLQLCRELGNVHGEANARLNLAGIHERLGERKPAIRCVEEAVRLYRRAHDRPQEAHSLALLGDAYGAAGDLPRARVAWEQAVAILDELAIPAGDVRARLDHHASEPT